MSEARSLRHEPSLSPGASPAEAVAWAHAELPIPAFAPAETRLQPDTAVVHDLGPAIAESLAFDAEVHTDHDNERGLLYREMTVILAILLFVVVRSFILA